MKVKIKIKKNKFGTLEGEPIFENKKVIFPVFKNKDSFLYLAEGQEWETEIITVIPLNRTDKKGQPMFKGISVLKEMIKKYSLVRVDNKGKFVFKVSSGYCELPEEIIQGELIEKKLESFSDYLFRKRLGKRDEYVYYDCRYKYEDYSPQVVYEKSEYKADEYYKEEFDKLKEKQDLLRKEAEEYDKKVKEIIGSSEVPISLKYFYENGVSIIKIKDGDPLSPLNGHENNVFTVGDFKFKPVIKIIDEDYLEYDNVFTTLGNVTKEQPEFDLLTKIMFFAVKHYFIGRQRYYLPYLNIPEHQPKIIYSEYLKSQYSAGRISKYESYNRIYEVNDNEREKIFTDAEEVFESYKPNIHTFGNDMIRIIIKEIVRLGYQHYSSYEEGVGMKDDTYYSGFDLALTVCVTYEYSYETNLILHPSIEDEIKKIIEIENKSQTLQTFDEIKQKQ